mmetsp:Transcript_4185/g.12036  ORF Transcript_4185/g.12036 Transcript_4185/m.12036 type:complete len:224 (+) Transcript_4185:3229-3900(+)
MVVSVEFRKIRLQQVHALSNEILRPKAQRLSIRWMIVLRIIVLHLCSCQCNNITEVTLLHVFIRMTFEDGSVHIVFMSRVRIHLSRLSLVDGISAESNFATTHSDKAPGFLTENPVLIIGHQPWLEDSIQIHLHTVSEIHFVAGSVHKGRAILVNPVFHVGLEGSTSQLVERIFDGEVLRAILKSLMNNVGDTTVVLKLGTEIYTENRILGSVIGNNRQDTHA